MNKNIVSPRHIAIIMDGNGRWAEEINKSRSYGHRAGHTSVLKIVKHAVKRNIRSLTLFAFSSENWSRPDSEIKYLMLLFDQAIKRNRKLFLKHKIRFNVIGDKSKFSKKLQQNIEKLEKETANHKSMLLNIAANYGGKWDIVQATKKVVDLVKENIIYEADIDENLLKEQICLSEQDPVDLLIRTGGEKRISNYLLWQIAYAEIYFTDTLWPDFDEKYFDEAICDFSHRTRKFGGLIDKNN